MASVPEQSSTWVSGIYQLEIVDPVLGGSAGISNLQAKQLADRTAYLKVKTDKLLASGLFANGIFQAETNPSGVTLDIADVRGCLVTVGPDGSYTDPLLIELPVTGAVIGDTIGIAAYNTDTDLIITATPATIYRPSRDPNARSFLRLGKGIVILRYLAGGTWFVIGSDASDDVIPCGAIQYFHVGTPTPAGFLNCDNSNVLKADYPLLFSIIGTTYGPGTSTEFTLPDSSDMTALTNCYPTIKY